MRFLLLDDEKISRYTLTGLVQNLPNATFVEAEDASQARRCLTDLSAPVVCIFDVRLPGESGLELLTWLRRQPRYQTFPVLLFTGNDIADMHEQAAGLNVHGYLPKPPDKDSIAMVAAVAARLAEELLPDPQALAQRLGTTRSHLMRYVEALEKQMVELADIAGESERQAQLARCTKIAKAMGSTYFLQTLHALQETHAAADDAAERQAAAMLALGGMRERIDGRY